MYHAGPANPPVLRASPTNSNQSEGRKWLRGCAVVKTSPPPWNMLIGKKVATCKWLHSYAVVKTTPPPQNMLVRKEEATLLRSGYVVTA